MDSKTPGDQVNLDEAKARFQAALADNPMRKWVDDHPWTTIALALGAGVVVGSSPRLRRQLVSGAKWLAQSGVIPGAVAALQGAKEPPPGEAGASHQSATAEELARAQAARAARAAAAAGPTYGGTASGASATTRNPITPDAPASA